TTCSICIDEFEEGEKVRLLPLCGHGFHTDCILPWLKDRQGCCPLCKTAVLD
ncbi:ring finger protein 13, partial [Fragilariopsis cylindrus CCMP1102]